MSEYELPEWDGLPEDQKMVVSALQQVTDMMGSFPPERVILLAAYLMDGLVDTLAARIVAAHQMGVGEEIDPRVNVAGIAFSSCMESLRDAYDICFNDEALAEITTGIMEQLKAVTSILELGENGDIDVNALLAKLTAMRPEGGES